MRTKTPWHHTLAHGLYVVAVLYLLGGGSLVYAAIVTDYKWFWFVGSMLIVGAVIVARVAWDIRK